MPLELKKEEAEQIIPSIQKYFRQELDIELGEMQAKFVLGFFQKEIAPYAYNKGVADAEKFFRDKIEDLSGSCFEPESTFWLKKKS